MIPIKEYIANQFVGKKLHLKCDCLVGLDVQGPCVGYDISGTEILLHIEVNGRTIPIGLNTPNLNIAII